jgi:type I restriction enzyme S subunit
MEGSELPAGWVTVALGDLMIRVDAGKSFRCIERPPTEGEVGIVKVSAVSWGSFRPDESKTVPDGIQLGPGSVIEEGDLLFSRANTIELVGACVQVGKIDKELHLSDKILRLVIAEEAIKPWIHRFLSSPGARKYLSDASSGNQLSMRNISQKVLLEAAIPLAPPNEQRRIAAKLDTTLAAVEACRQRLDRVAAILKRFRQAVLAAATSGELTREWREERNDHCERESTTFGAVCEYITVGFVGKMADQYCASGVPFLRSLNVRPFRFDPDNLAFISPEFHQAIIKSSLSPGDLAVVRTGAPGQCCVIPESLPESNCSDLVIARPGPSLHPDFGAIVINSSLGQGFVKSEQVGVAQAHFNVGSMKRAPLNLPSIAEQQEIVRRAQELFTLADQLKAKLTAARKLVERLTPALLARAFRGELVPQDPSDESASVLLERIRAARQAGAAAGKPSRRERRSAAAHPEQAPLPAAPVPADLLSRLLQECGALSERALLAASELDSERFRQQLEVERSNGAIRVTSEDGQELLEAKQ